MPSLVHPVHNPPPQDPRQVGADAVFQALSPSGAPLSLGDWSGGLRQLGAELSDEALAALHAEACGGGAGARGDEHRGAAAARCGRADASRVLLRRPLLLDALAARVGAHRLAAEARAKLRQAERAVEAMERAEDQRGRDCAAAAARAGAACEAAAELRAEAEAAGETEAAARAAGEAAQRDARRAAEHRDPGFLARALACAPSAARRGPAAAPDSDGVLGSREAAAAFAAGLAQLWHGKSGDVVDELVTNLRSPGDHAARLELLAEAAARAARRRGEADPPLNLAECLCLFLHTLAGPEVDAVLGYERVPPWREGDEGGEWSRYERGPGATRNAGIAAAVQRALCAAAAAAASGSGAEGAEWAGARRWVRHAVLLAAVAHRQQGAKEGAESRGGADAPEAARGRAALGGLGLAPGRCAELQALRPYSVSVFVDDCPEAEPCWGPIAAAAAAAAEIAGSVDGGPVHVSFTQRPGAAWASPGDQALAAALRSPPRRGGDSLPSPDAAAALLQRSDRPALVLAVAPAGREVAVQAAAATAAGCASGPSRLQVLLCSTDGQGAAGSEPGSTRSGAPASARWAASQVSAARKQSGQLARRGQDGRDGAPDPDPPAAEAPAVTHWRGAREQDAAEWAAEALLRGLPRPPPPPADSAAPSAAGDSPHRTPRRSCGGWRGRSLFRAARAQGGPPPAGPGDLRWLPAPAVCSEDCAAAEGRLAAAGPALGTPLLYALRSVRCGIDIAALAKHPADGGVLLPPLLPLVVDAAGAAAKGSALSELADAVVVSAHVDPGGWPRTLVELFPEAEADAARAAERLAQHLATGPARACLDASADLAEAEARGDRLRLAARAAAEDTAAAQQRCAAQRDRIAACEERIAELRRLLEAEERAAEEAQAELTGCQQRCSDCAAAEDAAHSAAAGAGREAEAARRRLREAEGPAARAERSLAEAARRAAAEADAAGGRSAEAARRADAAERSRSAAMREAGRADAELRRAADATQEAREAAAHLRRLCEEAEDSCAARVEGGWAALTDPRAAQHTVPSPRPASPTAIRSPPPPPARAPPAGARPAGGGLPSPMAPAAAGRPALLGQVGAGCRPGRPTPPPPLQWGAATPPRACEAARSPSDATAGRCDAWQLQPTSERRHSQPAEPAG
eukprot:TRINITY_DN6639_c1_g1_i1.p1 TRINITY_DN6639_c1_g1~~TRINITY_DN6639_c1_g1_i1.p1  ORF type:complete len:1184 (+),score=356.45 TRINITY_DN6639_c1_g1_i1:104-3553(+)